MRKKSHISVAKYIVNSSGMEELLQHKRAFYIGSVLPDCTISFFTRKHCMEETFFILEKEIRKITEEYDFSRGMNPYFCRHLGVIIHYVADYFTFPHNTFYAGTIKAHCKYEKQLKFVIREYIRRENVQRCRTDNVHSVEDICLFIKKMHQEYAKVQNTLENDCEYITMLCHYVVDAILNILEEKSQQKQAEIA